MTNTSGQQLKGMRYWISFYSLSSKSIKFFTIYSFSLLLWLYVFSKARRQRSRIGEKSVENRRIQQVEKQSSVLETLVKRIDRAEEKNTTAPLAV